MSEKSLQFLFYRQLRPQPSASGTTVANWVIGADDQYRGLQGRLALLRDPLIWMDSFCFCTGAYYSDCISFLGRWYYLCTSFAVLAPPQIVSIYPRF